MLGLNAEKAASSSFVRTIHVEIMRARVHLTYTKLSRAQVLVQGKDDGELYVLASIVEEILDSTGVLDT